VKKRAETVTLRVSDAFDLASLVEAFRTAGWRASRGRRVCVDGAVMDTAGRDALGAGLAAVEETIAGRRRLSLWVVPLASQSGPARLLCDSFSPNCVTLEKELTTRARLVAAGDFAAVGRFRRSVVPINLKSDAGRVRAALETLAPSKGGAPAAFLRLDLVRGGRETLTLASGLARLQRGVGEEAPGDPQRLLAMLGLTAGPQYPRPEALRASMSAAAAATALVKRYYEYLIANEDGARAGFDDEFVHAMRVATRRLRAVLRMFESALHGEAAGRAAEELKWLAGVLGAVRDLDVYMAGVPIYLERLEAPAPDYGFYLEALARRRSSARREMLRALSSERYGALKALIEALITEPPVVEKRPLLSLARKRVKSVARKAFEAADAARTDEELHRARISMKRLRYAAEFLTDLAPKPLARLARCAASFQDVLGRHQDATVACRRVREAVRAERNDRLRAFLLGYLLACARLAAIDARRDFHTAWAGGAKDLLRAANSASKAL
jgi:CHAD domain-containing protein